MLEILKLILSKISENVTCGGINDLEPEERERYIERERERDEKRGREK
jgi:hypothetical protein